jgi:cellulose synthase/poly-beta-1,6-N-acetylglucosamine synthase-like glycosyltransferase
MANSICVLIPAYNEQLGIKRTILSCLEAGRAPEDIYVVDDGSKDDTSIVARLLGVNVMTQKNTGKAGALKNGFDGFHLAERYSHLAVMDADSTMRSDYFSEMQTAIDAHPEVALFCGSPRSMPHNWLTAYRAVEYAISLGIYREAQSFMGTINVSPGCASIYRTDIFATLHFDGDTLVEDMDMTIQLQRRKEKILYVADAIVYTQDPKTIWGFLGQVKRWYRGTWQVVRKHKVARHAQMIDVELALMLGEGLGFAALLLAVPYAVYRWPHASAGVFLLDQILMFSLTLLVARRERRWDVIVAFPLFIIPRVLNLFAFSWAFIVERRPKKVQWFSVARY